MMVNSGTGAWLDLETTAPHRRFDTKLRRDRGLTLRTGCLCRSQAELAGADDPDRGKCCCHNSAIPLFESAVKIEAELPAAYLGVAGPEPAPLRLIVSAIFAISAGVSDNVAASSQPSTWRG